MDISFYMKEPVRYRAVSLLDNADTGFNLGGIATKEDVPEQIKYMRMDGTIKTTYTSGDGKVKYTEGYIYISTESLNLMDTINDMYIRGKDVIYNFDGTISHYEYKVGGIYK